MHSSPSIAARALKKRAKKLQNGSLVSFTVVAHPPAEFGTSPRTIGLVQLEDGSHVLAPLLIKHPKIGMQLVPRMRLQQVNPEKLRLYDVAYEEAIPQPKTEDPVFPGYILALTGPSGVGKTTVSRLLLQACNEYIEHVPIVTTRMRKKGDEDEYTYVTKEKFAQMLEKEEIVAAAKLPAAEEDRWYGYRSADIEKIWKNGKLPVVITEMHLLQGLAKHYGRRSILSCGLMPPGKSKRAMLSHLLRRLRNRGRETEEQIALRLNNAEKDLAFFHERKDLFDHVMVNDDLDRVIALLRKQVPGLEI
jgi:guanylate kinase